MSRLLFNPITFLGITVVSVIFSISLYKSAQKTQISNENLASMKAEVEQVEAEVAALEVAIDDSQQPFAKEEIIRNELLMKKPGEYVVQIPEQLVATIQADQEIITSSPWEEWQKLLF